jgi:hypothetical protein
MTSAFLFAEKTDSPDVFGVLAAANGNNSFVVLGDRLIGSLRTKGEVA